jgi:C-terminal processing protease CtpA/Prc
MIRWAFPGIRHERAVPGDHRRSAVLLVREVLPGSSGARAGLAAGDRIAAIDGKPVAAIGLAAARQMLKAGAGRNVRLSRADRTDATVILERLL